MGAPPVTCPQCGASHALASESCASRFAALLALDHSRRAPWGPLHALAFAAYALQHPADHAASLERSWLVAYRVTASGDDPFRLATALRASPHATLAEYGVPPFPAGPPPARFSTTIADLGDFDADGYEARCLAWARSAVAGWSGGDRSEPSSRHAAP